jgi:hypothetical protein
MRDIPLAFGIFKIQTIGAYYYVFFLPFILAYSRISSHFLVVPHLSVSFPYKKSHEESSKLGHKPNVHKIMGEGNAVGVVVVLLLDLGLLGGKGGLSRGNGGGRFLCYTKRDEQQKNPSQF